MIKTLGIKDINLRAEILKLFSGSHAAQLYMSDTGFPVNWYTDPFWN